MEYRDFTQPVQRLGFIGSPDKADAATKAVLGILASRLEADEARRLTERLPEPLSLDRLRGHQKRTEDITAEQYLAEVAAHCTIDDQQASQLVDTVLHCTKETIGEERMQEISSKLPSDWGRLIGRA